MKRIAFTIADENNMQLANNMINSLRKFHSEEELPVHIVSGEELQNYLKQDPHFFYRATPIMAKKFMEEGYDYVLKLDADQIIMGDLDYVLNSEGWEVGTVINVNRVDPPKFGWIGLFSLVAPQEYFNCGLVAMKSKEFVDHWHSLCFSQYFERMPYREQGFLNLLTHFGTYKVKCFDHYDKIYDYGAWHGLLAKGEGMRMKLVDGKVILPRGEDDDQGYPDRDVEIKVYHFAGGGYDSKNHRIYFPEELINHIDWLISDERKKEPEKS